MFRRSALLSSARVVGWANHSRLWLTDSPVKTCPKFHFNPKHQSVKLIHLNDNKFYYINAFNKIKYTAIWIVSAPPITWFRPCRRFPSCTALNHRNDIKDRNITFKEISRVKMKPYFHYNNIHKCFSEAEEQHGRLSPLTTPVSLPWGINQLERSSVSRLVRRRWVSHNWLLQSVTELLVSSLPSPTAELDQPFTRLHQKLNLRVKEVHHDKKKTITVLNKVYFSYRCFVVKSLYS